jgi:hypothetical protein
VVEGLVMEEVAMAGEEACTSRLVIHFIMEGLVMEEVAMGGEEAGTGPPHNLAIHIMVDRDFKVTLEIVGLVE